MSRSRQRTCRSRQCRSGGLQKATPGRGGDFGPPRHVSADRGLADFEPELEQFAVDSGRPPERVGQAHVADQITDLGAHLGSSQMA